MHAVSKDLIHWRHVTEEPALVPSQPHDAEGVFSGVMIPSGPCGEPGLLTAIYTAVRLERRRIECEFKQASSLMAGFLSSCPLPSLQVSQLPIHYTKPYRPGSEKLAMAISQDDGKTWQRNKASVVLDGPPDSLASDIVSWRDPYIAPWPAMDEKLALPPGRFIYGLISGGLRGKTPALFLYRIERNDIGKWTHVAQLADVGLNFTLGEHAGDMGQNWEVCNFFLDGPDTFLLINVEGVDGVPKRRHAMWTKTDIKCTGQGDEIQGPQVRMEPRYSALIDYGCLYAATTFEHAPTGRRILWGWVTEDDLAEEQCEAQGWAGCMSLPREISTSVYQDVDAKLLKRPLFAHSFWPLQSARLGTKASHDVATIGHRPAAETVQLRTGATHFAISDPPAGFTLPYHSRNFELCVDVEVAAATGGSSFGSQEVGVFIAHNADATLGTKVVYSFEDEMLRVDRSASSTSAHVDRSTKWAPLGLVRFADGSWEPLRLHVYLDNSVLEVFANGRVSLTTRIYCDSPDCARVSLLPSNAKGGGSAATATAASGAAPTRFARVEAWVGLQKAMLPTHPFDAFACPDAI